LNTPAIKIIPKTIKKVYNNLNRLKVLLAFID
jgi:hypothetical protein